MQLKLVVPLPFVFAFIIFINLTTVFVSSDVQPGFPCEGIPNFCDRVECVPPKDCKLGIVVKGGGNCGCCDVCITYQGFGDICDSEGTEPAVIPPGVVAQYYKYDNSCHPGLICRENVCSQPKSGDKDYKKCAFQFFDHWTNQWEGKPVCDAYGNYGYKRCKGSTNPRCFCVNENGDTIFGRLPTGSENATCACSRVVSDTLATVPAATFIRCTEVGDFSELQCWGEVCFCVNSNTRLMTSVAVPISGIKALPCWDDDLYSASFYTQCTSELIRMKGIVKEFQLKGMTLNFIDLPNCDPDGTYGFVQFQTNKYYCSDRTGVQMSSYYTDDYTSYLKMICNCARDEKYPEGLPDSSRGRSCDSLGNYKSMYCIASASGEPPQCFCLDSDGQQSSSSFPMSDDIDCEKTFPPNHFEAYNVWTLNEHIAI